MHKISCELNCFIFMNCWKILIIIIDQLTTLFRCHVLFSLDKSVYENKVFTLFVAIDTCNSGRQIYENKQNRDTYFFSWIKIYYSLQITSAIRWASANKDSYSITGFIHWYEYDKSCFQWEYGKYITKYLYREIIIATFSFFSINNWFISHFLDGIWKVSKTHSAKNISINSLFYAVFININTGEYGHEIYCHEILRWTF